MREPARHAGARDVSPRGAGTPAPQVTARLYCQGIGDCHLLKFRKADGGDFWMLIDCGIHSSIEGGTQKIARIVEDIASVTRRLDVVVATHEHWDHISGFLTAAADFKSTFQIGEIWMPWTENPRDDQARALDKFKGQALAALQGASQRLDGAKQLSANLSIVQSGLQSVLGFNFGAQGERVRAARDALVQLAPDRVRYLEPKDPPVDVPELPNLRIYVLGPPRDEALIGVRERASEMYGLAGGRGWAMANALTCAFTAGETSAQAQDYAAPFDPNVGSELARILDKSAITDPLDSNDPDVPIARFVRDHYSGRAEVPAGAGKVRKPRPSESSSTDQSWRRIDHDWLGASADLAMQLDSRTNNTSLVLAFEFIDTGRVMLFAADAQVGNWLSWQDVKWQVGEKKVTGPNLLARTVFYKVGHHGSQNATLRQKGLELMIQPDLSAFIPTNEKDAKNVKWGQMPFPDICNELERRASGRVIRADDPWIATDRIAAGFTPPSGAVLGLRHGQGLYVEFDIG